LNTSKLKDVFVQILSNVYVMWTSILSEIWDSASCLQMLDISDPVITNCLIDQRRIEFVLLCESKEEATDTMLHNPPPKYQEMFTMNGDQLFSWPCFRLYPCKPTSARFLSADMEQLIRQCHSDRSELDVALRQKTEEVLHTRDGIKKRTEVSL